MTIAEYNDAVTLVIRLLKEKYTNLTAEDAHTLATRIVVGVASLTNSTIGG